MAKKWSDEEKQELASLVQTLYLISPFRSWAEFARVAGVHPVSISRWQQGQDAPEGYNLLRLLRASGAEALLVAAANRAETTGTPDYPAELEDAAIAVIEEVRSGFGRLSDRLDRLEKQHTPAARRSPAKASRKRQAG